MPSDSAVYQARDRLGWAPIRWLCQRVLRPLAEAARDPSAFYDGRCLLAVDGTTFTVADTPSNVWTFGLAGRVTQARAQDPLRAMQELDGLLLGHFVVRWVILQAAREKGIAPVEISFAGTLRILQTRLARGCRRGRWSGDAGGRD